MGCETKPNQIKAKQHAPTYTRTPPHVQSVVFLTHTYINAYLVVEVLPAHAQREDGVGAGGVLVHVVRAHRSVCVGGGGIVCGLCWSVGRSVGVSPLQAEWDGLA
jgi:hypothetical protein